ncbi:hypothetical protein PDE_06977 [Penicillium oxalicum 114-2]|uniref:Uncharacterized protein n=1 Tax=Penicillium oxalicum (strain 114-2 / CGMCC 5302) TaxID=933388 RepID=S8AZX8_PENO1|nr:hypothetical protein PDE_06977 [Penicillium oxalicum 114-2]
MTTSTPTFTPIQLCTQLAPMTLCCASNFGKRLNHSNANSEPSSSKSTHLTGKLKSDPSMSDSLLYSAFCHREKKSSSPPSGLLKWHQSHLVQAAGDHPDPISDHHPINHLVLERKMKRPGAKKRGGGEKGKV